MFASRTGWKLTPNRLALALENHRRGGAQLCDLTASNPTTCGFEYPEGEILAALADPRALIYRPESKGLREAREAVANYYRGRAGFTSAELQLADARSVRPESADANRAHGARTDMNPADAAGVTANPVPAVSVGAHPAHAASASVDRGHAASVVDTRIDPENIVLTSGTSEGYSFLFRLLCEPGDEILVPAPSYPLFEFLADLADVRLVSYPLLYDHGWQIDPDGLRNALTPRARAVLVVHPNNPTGSFVKQIEAAELADICAGRDMAVVADEVFLDYPALNPTGDRTTGGRAVGDGPAAGVAAGAARTFAFGSAALTFTLSGISKICALPQMKLAWIVAGGPQELVAAAMERLEVIADTFLSPGAPAQAALPRFLEMRGNLQAQLQQRVAANLAYLDALLQRQPSPLERLAREAGWYAVLRIPSSRPDEEYAAELLERCAVLVHPGQFFNFSQEGFLVLSLIAPELEFQEGARRLHKFWASDSTGVTDR